MFAYSAASLLIHTPCKLWEILILKNVATADASVYPSKRRMLCGVSVPSANLYQQLIPRQSTVLVLY